MPKRLQFPRDMVSLPEAINWITYDQLKGPTAGHLEHFNRRAAESDRPESRWMRRTPAQIQDMAEDSAREDLLVALRDGDLRAIGRLSESQTQPWNSRNGPWGLHSGKYTEIPLEFWIGGQANFRLGKLTYSSGEYIEIRVSLFFLQILWPVPAMGIDSSDALVTGTEGGEPLPFAPTPYLELLNRAVERFWCAGSPPTDKKEIIVQWLVEQEIGGEPLSRNLAETMATLIRPLEARAGGNRRW